MRINVNDDGETPSMKMIDKFSSSLRNQ